jgi:hypothetical protein
MQKQRWSFPPSARSARTTVKLMLIGLLVMLVPAGALFAASQTAKPGITLQVSPASQSIERAKTASYVVTATSTGGFSGAVALSASGLPAGSSASFSPSSIPLEAGSTATATMTVSTGQSTPIGTYSLGIKGVSGKVSGTVSAGLTINYPISSSFTMNATPASVTMSPGSTGVFSIQLSRSNFTGPVNLSVLGGLPAGSTPTFAPNPATGNTSTLEVITASNAPNGTYTLYLVGSGPDANGKTQYAYASAQLVIDSTLKNFTLSGNLGEQPGDKLAPGISRPLDLGITNPNKKALAVTNLSVSIKSVTRTADAIARNLPCGTADYTVTQYSGPYPLTVQPGPTTLLSGLGIPSTKWPQVKMLDTPTNQDGCKGATLQLVYSGSGQGN